MQNPYFLLSVSLFVTAAVLSTVALIRLQGDQKNNIVHHMAVFVGVSSIVIGLLLMFAKAPAIQLTAAGIGFLSVEASVLFAYFYKAIARLATPKVI